MVSFSEYPITASNAASTGMVNSSFIKENKPTVINTS